MQYKEEKINIRGKETYEMEPQERMEMIYSKSKEWVNKTKEEG